MGAFTEVADGIFRQRYNPLDVGVTVIRGSDGLAVVDTRSSHREGQQILDDVTALSDQPIRWVVNTHAHYDHTWGNGVFGPTSPINATIYGHRLIPAHFEQYEVPLLQEWIDGDEEGRGEEWREIVLTPPSVLVDAGDRLDLGDRVVEFHYFGRGHTDNDLFMHLPGQRAWIAGDEIEQSGPPYFGTGCFPLEWAATLTTALAEFDHDDQILPGHGEPLDTKFAAAQRDQLQVLADLLRELHAEGVPAEQAFAAGGDRWPFPTDGLEFAVRDGFRQLSDGSSS
jgi:glyoxylase-like metal-dependent hydrolase (beta-lactamase superfamily II)